MKKAVSLLASFTLAFSLFGAPALSFADEKGGVSFDQGFVLMNDDIALLGDERDAGMLEYLDGLDEKSFSDAQAPTTGSVEVRLTTLLADPSRTGGLKATISGPSTKSVDFVAKSATELSENGYVAKLDGVAPGSYSLVVEGPGFLPYSQSGVTVEAGRRAVLTLVDQYSDVYCAEDVHKGNGGRVLVDVCAGYGLIPYGNLDGDRGIDNADAKVLLQAIARVRAGATLSADETARFGMNLMRDVITANDKGDIEETRPVEVPEDDEATLSSLTLQQEGSLSNANAADPYTEVQLTYNAGGENPQTAAAGQPEFRIANASEDVDAGAQDVTTAPLADTDEDDESEIIVDETMAGMVGRVKHTEPIAVGLNAFQKLATLKNARTATAKVTQVSETSHMQAVASDDTDVVIDSGKSLPDVLFNDDGEVVKMYPAGDASISETNPVELTINTQGTTMDAITITVPNDSPNAPTAGQVIVQSTNEDDDLITCDFVSAAVGGRISSVVDMRSNAFAADTARLAYGADESGSAPTATMSQASGVITIDLKGQIPVKTITIRVTDTSSKKLAEIAQVEFLNGFEHKIPEPELNIPKLNSPAAVGSKSITITWGAERNVTGYEVEISYNGAASVISTVKNGTTLKNIAGKELVNYRTYTLRARSVNGEWRSPWSASITATPQADGVPKSPAAPRIVGGYDSVTVSWSAVEDAEWHNLYYRKQVSSNATPAAWTKVDISKDALKHTITGLDLKTTYEAYIEGVNRHGTGPKSKVVSATTTPNAVKVPWYKLLNQEAIQKEKGLDSFESVIEKVEIDYNKGGDPMSMVDGDYDTYITGAKGGYHHGGTVTFKDTHAMDTIMLTGYQGQSLNIYDLIVQAWDENNQPIKPSGGNIKKSVLTYSSNTRTVMIRTEKLEGVKKIRVAYQRAVGNAWSAATIAELAFYNSTLYSDVMDVWADDEHTQLKDGITEQKLLGLQTDVNTPDVIQTQKGEVSEYHPSKSVLLAELENALIVCRAGSLRAPIKVDGNLNTVGAKRGVGGLNGWQPLGVAAAAGDEISVYVGRKGETNGAVPLAIYVVQNHPDISNGFAVRLDSAANKVQVGLNTFRIPENITSIKMERGGSLYVEYGTSRGNNEQYTVRVAGGTEIPLLDIHNVTNADARMDLIRSYVTSLKAYDPEVEHAAKGHVTPPDDTEYHSGDCIANATDIVLKDMMYSVPASTVAANIGVNKNSSAEEVEAAAQKLSKSLSAMDDMMTLFYQHKGFVKNTADAAKAGFGSNNAWPTLHQNIRYVQCSGSTFMYAAGNHIGIQGGSVGGLVSIPGVTADANGKYQSGKYFGWGIAHEIGHEINNGAYTYAEVTNNYYSQLAQATDMPGNYKTRWGSYDGIYKRVSSGAKGMAMGKTGIAMYWQLHLAYDDGYNFKTYSNAADQFNNLIFARMDAYARNVGAAPNNGHALTLSGANKDNALMRLACAATQKNLLGFFEAWGLTPDAETKAYAKQWPDEERAIQYQTDALRLFRKGDLDGLGVSSNQIGAAAKNASVTATLDYPGAPDSQKTESQTITVKLDGATVSEGILGYEVLRNDQVVGFLRANDFEGCSGVFDGNSATFVDTIHTVNNRVFTYQVRAVDKLLQRGDLVDAGTVKVSHKNLLDKTNWTATTNMASGATMPNDTQAESVVGVVNGETVVNDAEGYFENDELFDAADADLPLHPIENAIDDDMSTVFSGAIPTDKDGNVRETDARITIDLGGKVEAVGFRVKGASASSGFVVQTSLDGVTWNTIPTITSAVDDIIYFSRESDKYLYAHETAYLRLTLPGQTSYSVAEIDVFGPQGDDAEFLPNGIGVLAKDEILGTNASNETRKIPAGSLVFLGTYKGNPAFNAILLFDQNKKVLGGVSKDGAIHAEEVIFAPKVADGSMLGDVEEGFWAYYILPEYLTDDWINGLKSVKAELYRVDNATTLEGQRLVADTLSVEMPTDLSKIDLTFGAGAESQSAESMVEHSDQPNVVDGGVEMQQLAGSPIESADISGYTYDFAEMYSNEPSSLDGVQGGAAGTPIYGSPIDQSVLGGTPIYGDAGGPILGTPIYDDATPLASPSRKSRVLAKTAVRSVSETFIVAIEDVGVVDIVKSLG